MLVDEHHLGGHVAVTVAVTRFGLGFPMYRPISESYHHIHCFPLLKV